MPTTYESGTGRPPEVSATIGPWTARCSGGRLADVYHAESEAPVMAFEVDGWDWQEGRVEPVTPAALQEQLQAWADEDGAAVIENVVRYASR